VRGRAPAAGAEAEKPAIQARPGATTSAKRDVIAQETGTIGEIRIDDEPDGVADGAADGAGRGSDLRPSEQGLGKRSLADR
jgi:hypothetical protein